MAAKALLTLALAASLATAAEWRVTTPRVEYLLEKDALGIDVPAPRFGWVVEPADDAAAAVRGAAQQAFQLVVAEADTGKVVWDSGRVNSSESRHAVFGSLGAKPQASLSSATAYDWTVRVWVAEGVQQQQQQQQQSQANTNANVVVIAEARTEAPARFVTGALDAAADWAGAEWLVAASPAHNLCRRAFSLPAGPAPRRAVLLVSGLGYFQATVNGQRATDAELEPGWTDYTKRVPYATYDVTRLLLPPGGGDNVLGLALGHGWYASVGGGEPSDVPRTFLAKLVVGGATVLTTAAGGPAGGWTCAKGPISYDSVYHGEVYDARAARAVAGWDTAGFAAAAAASSRDWQPAVVSPNPPAGALVSPKMPPVRRVEALAAVAITEPRPGVFVVDFGQNIAGRVALALPGSRRAGGGNVTLRHAEVLQHAGIVAEPEAGMLYVDNLRSARATDVFVFEDAGRARGHGAEEDEPVVFEPTFTYHGFRYVEATGYEPRLSDLKAWVMHTDVAEVGSVAFSDPLLNRIQRAIHWGQRANVMSVPTDCPQRDERKGWLGDAQLSGEEALANFDMVATLIKFLHDIADTQNAAGQISDTAPFTFGGRPADPSWGSAFPSLVYFLFRETGDRQIVRDFYPALVKYADSLVLAAEAAGLANLYKSYGDWCNLPGTPMCSPHMTGSFSLLENLGQMRALAAALGAGYEDDAKLYAAYHASFTRAFHAAFYKEGGDGGGGGGTYDNGVQTCLALPLWANATPAEARAGIEAKLLADLTETQGYHATVGIIGMKYMLETLSQLGRTDAAVRMLQRTDYPSFGYMLLNDREPATTIWELWDADRQGPGMNSRNHVMFGGPVGGWFYKFLGGVRPSDDVAPTAAGYREAVLAPPLGACLPLESATTSIRTLQGPVAMAWRRAQPAPAAANGTGTGTGNDTVAALVLDVRVPVGGKGRVLLDGRRLPAASPLQVRVDGAALAAAEAQGVEVLAARDDYVELRLPSGAWGLDVAYAVPEEALRACEGGAASVRFAEPEVALAA